MTPRFTLCDKLNNTVGTGKQSRACPERSRRATHHELRITNHGVSPTPATLTIPLEHKSLPCHSYKLFGGGGCQRRVHISLNSQHLAFSTLRHFIKGEFHAL
jgi:hypothetical protein